MNEGFNLYTFVYKCIQKNNYNIIKILKIWFYCFKKVKEKENIKISSNLKVSIFYNQYKNLNIEIWENSELNFLGTLEWEEININFLQKEINSSLTVRYLLLSKNNQIKAKIYSELWACWVKSDVEILSMVWDKWFINLN